jgi:hypothetical protein
MVTYRFKEDEILKMLDFVKRYHLEPSKGSRGRTNQGSRGFGGELDDFLIKNLTEVAACKIIQSFSPGEGKKELHPDFNVYTNKEVTQRNDPDITEVVDVKSGVIRDPYVRVEVKKTSSNEDWFNARKEQIEEYLNNDTKGYMVHVSLEFKDEKDRKNQSITGAILKKVIDKTRFDLSEFSDIEDLEAKIDFAYSYKNLKEKGFFFPAGSIMPHPALGEYKGAGLTLKDGTQTDHFQLLESYKGKSKISMKLKSAKNISESPNIDLFKDWDCEGNFSIYRKKKTGNSYIFTNQDSTFENRVLGRYTLEANKMYKCFIENKLGTRDQKVLTKNIDEYSFSRRKLENLQNESKHLSVESTCKEIARFI